MAGLFLKTIKVILPLMSNVVYLCGIEWTTLHRRKPPPKNERASYVSSINHCLSYRVAFETAT